MKKSEIGILPKFFDRYIVQVEDISITDALDRFSSIPEHQIQLLKNLEEKIYEPGKWTVKDILQHVIDNERIQSYRAMRFARNDKTELPGYDEKVWADNAFANRRSIDDLVAEFEIIRKGTLAMYERFDNIQLMREGVCFGVKLSVLSLGFVIAGHQIHHFKVIEEKYKPLLFQQG